MSSFGFLRTVLVMSVLGLGSASAQSLADADGPAELPPSGYTGAQYVDSNGCLFVRAGLNGDVTWVPRVSRSRELLCGFKPTLSASASTPIVAATPVAAKPKRTVRAVSVPAATTAVNAPADLRPVIPRGFRAAWTDGRLSRNRGPRTELGNAQMAQIWTNTVPAELVTE